MERVLGHRQTKGAATDHPHLPPPRHISTLPDRATVRGLCLLKNLSLGRRIENSAVLRPTATTRDEGNAFVLVQPKSREGSTTSVLLNFRMARNPLAIRRHDLSESTSGPGGCSATAHRTASAWNLLAILRIANSRTRDSDNPIAP